MDNLLQEIDTVFREVKDQSTQFETIPDGQYYCKIYDMVHKNSKAGKPGVLITLDIEAGAYQGRKIWKWLNLTGKDEKSLKRNLNTYANQCRLLGIDVENGLMATFEQFESQVGADVKVTIKTVKNFVNTKVEPYDGFIDSEEVGEDELPF